MTKESSDRLQINIRLSTDHTEKLLRLTKHATAGSVVFIGNDLTIPIQQTEVAPTTLANAVLSHALDQLTESIPASIVERPNQDVIENYDNAWDDPGALPMTADPMHQLGNDYGARGY